MPTRQKARTIDELSDQLTRANLVIVTDYRGLKVGDLQTLRGNLRPSGRRSTSPEHADPYRGR